MRYQTLQQAIKEITESHQADITYYTGLEQDFDPANDVNYPALVFTPPAFNLNLDNETDQANKTWKLHFETMELLSTESTTAEKNEALDRTGEYLKDIVLEFWITYGTESKTVTVNNITEALDFVITSQPIFAPFIDLGDNVTGWQVDLEITEQLKEDLCHLPDIFS